MSEKSVAAQIYRLLPGRNCGAGSPCGNALCLEFAKKLLSTENNLEDCTYLEEGEIESISLVLAEYFREQY